MKLPQVDQIVKTKKGDKTWKIVAVGNSEIALKGVTNGKAKFISHDQFLKNWKVI